MQLKTLLLAWFTATLAVALGVPTIEHRNMLDEGLQKKTTSSPEKIVPTIRVFVHVISASQSPPDGNVPDSMIYEQIHVLNKAFAPAAITFGLVGIDRTINPTWSNGGDEQNMKQALRQGGPQQLNVYLLSSLGGETGSTTFPWAYQATPQQDGSSILHTTLPGGTYTRHNYGITLVHEVGHWLGLFDTFAGGCSTPGDYVDDTHPQASGSFGCPVGRHSCPSLAGVDPVTNYMDTSDDWCRIQFTPGQISRMRQAAQQYRGITF